MCRKTYSSHKGNPFCYNVDSFSLVQCLVPILIKLNKKNDTYLYVFWLFLSIKFFLSKADIVLDTCLGYVGILSDGYQNRLLKGALF